MGGSCSEWVNGDGAGCTRWQGIVFRLGKSVLAEVDCWSAACGGAEATATAAGTRLSVYRLTVQGQSGRARSHCVPVCHQLRKHSASTRAVSTVISTLPVGSMLVILLATSGSAQLEETDSCGEEQRFSVGCRYQSELLNGGEVGAPNYLVSHPSVFGFEFPSRRGCW